MIITRLPPCPIVPPPVKASLDIPGAVENEVVYGSPWQVGRHHLQLLVSRWCNYFHKLKRHLQLLVSRCFRNRKMCSKKKLDIGVMFSWHPPLFLSLPSNSQPTTTTTSTRNGRPGHSPPRADHSERRVGSFHWRAKTWCFAATRGGDWGHV